MAAEHTGYEVRAGVTASTVKMTGILQTGEGILYQNLQNRKS